MNCVYRCTTMVFAALLSITSTGEALAGKFDEKTIKGTWALFVRGFVTPGGVLDGIFPGLPPIVAIATVSFDGFGNCASMDQLVVGGVRIPDDDDPEIFRVANACTYVVNADGTGFFRVTFPALDAIPVSTTTASFVIRDNQKMHFIADNNDIGIFGGGEMERQ